MAKLDLKGVPLSRSYLRMCRRNMKHRKVVDSSGMTMTGAELLLRSLIFRRLLLRNVLGEDEKYIGLLVPPSGAGMLANAAVSLCRRVAVNLNYTLSEDVLNTCIQKCGIRHVLTSRLVLKRLGVKFDAEPVFLEDFAKKVTLADKVVAAASAYALPLGLLEKSLGLDRVQMDDLLTVIFTSGSTGIPKGVMLSHGNVASNVQAFDDLAAIPPHEVFLGVLPFFHAFGYTVTCWGVLALDGGGAYHYNPLETETVAKLCREHGVTFIFGTPTLLRMYARKFKPEDVPKLEIVIAGAEKMPLPLADAFEKKFGIRPAEGFGATECAPLVSVNVPPSRDDPNNPHGLKEGTVGRPIPDVEAKVINVDSGADLPAGQPGLLLIRGPNVMQGYFDEPDQTAEVLRDGWYHTGDMAIIDDEGFIQITGRLSRFSKLGGEMVPHMKIEEVLARVLGAADDEMVAVVTAVGDEKKGERIVVLHKPIDQPPKDVCAALAAEGLPKLWIPSPDSFAEVDEFPMLGTGKLDLAQLRTLAAEKFGG